MKTKFDGVHPLFSTYARSLPDQLQKTQELESLANILPNCSYRLVGAVGNEVVRNPYFETPGPHPKRLDLDLIVPFVHCSSREWNEFTSAIQGSDDVTYWDNGNIMVLLNNGTFCLLNPTKYNDLDPETCQTEVAKVFAAQINPSNALLHQVDTGEATVFVGKDIANYANPKDDKYPGVYGDVYPLVLGPHQPDTQALFARGYLPQNGCVVILPNGEVFNLPVELTTRSMPELDTSYLSRSPQHAIQFLRRLTKSTINLFAHQRFFDKLPEQLKYFSEIYTEVATRHVQPYIDDLDLKKSLDSLYRKVKKLKKTITKENKKRAYFNFHQQLDLDLPDLQYAQPN
jgi:hypothetical protein